MKDEALKLALEALGEYVNVVVSVNDPNEWTPKVEDAGGLAREAITALRKALAEQPAQQEPVAIDGNTSDGYHTFNELYEFRKAYNAALFNEWAAGGKCSVHKSWRHHDGELCFGGGWFIVVAVLPDGQISNHYEAKDWDLFAVPETECALFEFDGHTGADVVERLKAYTTPPAAPVQEPEGPLAEGWCINFANGHSGFGVYAHMDEYPEEGAILLCGVPKWASDALKATPPAAQRQWVGLSQQDIDIAFDDTQEGGGFDEFARAIEAKLKEKNT